MSARHDNTKIPLWKSAVFPTKLAADGAAMARRGSSWAVGSSGCSSENASAHRRPRGSGLFCGRKLCSLFAEWRALSLLTSSGSSTQHATRNVVGDEGGGRRARRAAVELARAYQFDGERGVRTGAVA